MELPNEKPSEHIVVDLHLADSSYTNIDHSESENIPSNVSADIYAVHHLDRVKFVFGCLDAVSYR